VLAACTNALLGGRGPGVGARIFSEEYILELDHSGGGEHESRIVRGNERGTLDHGVAVFLEIIEEDLADLCACHKAINLLEALGPRKQFGLNGFLLERLAQSMGVG
jgi:hypothetical protein